MQRREHTSATALDGEIYVVGGRWRDIGELSSTEIYDPIDDAWRPVPTLAVPRAGHATVRAGAQLVVLEGEVILSGSEALDSMEVLDPTLGRWRKAGTLPQPLHGVAAVVDRGKLYVVGGSRHAGSVANDGRVFERVW